MRIQTDPYIRQDPPNLGAQAEAYVCLNGPAVDCHRNGTTIFTDQGKRPEVAIGENSDDSDTPDVRLISKGDRISFDEDQVGSGTPGGNPLMITMVLVKRG